MGPLKVLVTGGAGYIGSAVTRVLLRAGHEVVVLDDLSRGHRASLHPDTELIVGSLGDRQELEELFSGKSFDAVMHFAGLIEAGESMRVPELYFRNNTANSLNLLETMLAHGVRKFIFSSTAALYGDPRETAITEQHPFQPTNAYGESKRLVELMLDWFSRIHGLRYASLRYFNAAGALDDIGEDHRPESHLIPILLEVALGKRDHVKIFGADYPTPDGTCIRDYIHIADLAEAHVLALGALSSHQVLHYNLGSGKGFSVREVIQMTRRITGHPIPSIDSERRPGDPAVLVASPDKIRAELGWIPRFSRLEDIVSSAWNWRQRFRDGYVGSAPWIRT